MDKNKKHGTFLHGIAASEHLDSSGERIIISGVDISSLTTEGVINWEHESKTASCIVGKILEAKKILKKDDCETEHHKYFWNKVKMPYIYVAAELFDQVGHKEAENVAAMLRYDKNLNKDETKALINFSIEGSRLGREGSNITKCIARKVTATIHPCNKAAHAEQLDSPSQGTKKKGGIDISKEILSKFKKNEQIEIEIMKGDLKYFTGKWDKNKSKFNPDKDPKSKSNFKPLAPNSGEKSPGSALPKPKREFSPKDAPDKMKVGDRISYDKKRPRTGAEIYKDPKTWEKSEKKMKKALVDQGKSPKQKKRDRAKRKPGFTPKTKEKFTTLGAREMKRPEGQKNLKERLDKRPKTPKKQDLEYPTLAASEKAFYTSNVRKAITASIGSGAPGARTGGAALQVEDLGIDLKKRKAKRKKVLKSLSEESWKNYQYKDELISFLSDKEPNMNKREVLAVAKTYSYIEQIKAEKKLEEL
jgi:hypothetical protein